MNLQTATKFEKILALIDAAGSEGEAQAAAAAFQRLLLRHGVSEEEARAAHGTIMERYVAREVRVCPPKSPNVGWKSALMRTLARFSLCRAFQKPKGGWHVVVVIGKPSEITQLVQFYDRCANTFDRLADADVLAMKLRAQNRGYQPPHATSWRHSFLTGAVSGLEDKLRAERDALVANEVKVSALVIRRDEEIDAVLSDIGARVSSVAPRDNEVYGDAWHAGYRVGRGYQDTQELGGSAQFPRGVLHA